MPLIPLRFRPGINKDVTNYSNEGGWNDCDKVRFYAQFPQKLGGWKRATPRSFIGTCRQLWNWVTSFQDNFLALGTNSKVYLEAGGLFYDITPVRATFITPDTDNAIQTTAGSTEVVINIASSGAAEGDYFTLSGVDTDVGGIPVAELNAEHKVLTADAVSLTIQVTTPATSTVTAGGTAIEAEFQINVGFAATEEGYGFGTGAWGGGTSEMDPEAFGWGETSTSPVVLPQRDWWFDNFDNDLVMNIRSDASPNGAALGGRIYYWARGVSPTALSALQTRAVLLSSLPGASNVPETAMQILVSQNDKHLIAFGCQPFGGSAGEFDPLLIRWASQNEPENWTPSPTNTAGFIRVSRGSKIVRAVPTRQEILVFTDTHLYAFQFLGTLDVFGLQEYADSVSIISPRAVTSTNNITYWMGKDKFYMYDGRVQTLPTTVREFVFKDLDQSQAGQIVCGTNEAYNEVWWFYPSLRSGGWNDRYVIFNTVERVWYTGSMVRTAWWDVSSRPFPIGVATLRGEEEGIIYDHENGVDDDEAPMYSYIVSSDVDMDEGDKFVLTKRMIPDINFARSENADPEVSMGIQVRRFPGSNVQNDINNFKPVQSVTVNSFTEQVFIRVRGRSAALKLESTDLGVQWQLGTPRVDARMSGKQ